MAALAVAEQMTSAETPKAPGNDHTDETKAGDANASPPKDAGALVALLISRPDVKSASALKGLNVAIDAAQSAVEETSASPLGGRGRYGGPAFVSDASPLDRLISGDAHAAVVKLVSPGRGRGIP